jgi:LPXTG-site transpeptidase (sortase) family protein
MKLYYSAKCEEMLINPFRDEAYGIRLQAFDVFRVLKVFICLIVILWAFGVGYFFVYPLLPDVQELKMKAERYNPYLLGYSVTTQLFTALVPPVYDMTSLEQMAGSSERTIEYFDPEGVEVANLEAKRTELSVPSANIKGKVVDGLTQDAMMRGFWHYPLSSVPGKRGNVVFIGHRFQKLPPNTDTFFNLDKIKVGDKLSVAQGGEEWTYTVVSVRVAEKDDASVLASSGEYRLTLITCTPLWTAKQRLVVTGIQDRIDSVI